MNPPFKLSTMLVGFYALLFYVVAIHYHIADFPIYFFCDEAIHGVEANLIGQTGRDQSGKYLPLFPRGLGQYQLGASVYAQIPFTRLLGISEYSTRLRNVVISLLALWAVLQLVMLISGAKWSWVVPFICLTSPIWFLHYRSGFEAPMALAFLLASLAFFLRGLTNGPTLNWIFAAICGAISFYSYIPARGWVILLFCTLLLFNFKEIFRRHASVLWGSVAFLLLIVPFINFWLGNSEDASSRLRAVGMQEFLNRSTSEQFSILLKNYLTAIDPRFWFTWAYTNNSGPEERHIVPKLAPIATWLLPFFIVGLVRLLIHLREAASRSILALIIIAPIPASAFGITSLRTLPVGAAYIIVAICGLIAVFEWISKKISPKFISCCSVLALTVYGAWFENYALNVAPYRYKDYQFYGIQYGVPQTFEWIKSKGGNFETINLASNLFNASEIFIPFYLDVEQRSQVVLRDPRDICKIEPRLDPTSVWIVSNSVLTDLRESGCPVDFMELNTILDPLDHPLIKIGHFTHKSQFDAWYQKDQLKRHTLVVDRIKIKIGEFEIAHSRFDMGIIKDLFDSNYESLVRTAEVNPFRIELLAKEFQINRLKLRISNNRRIALRITSFTAQEKLEWPVVQVNSPSDSFDVSAINPEPSLKLNRLRIEVEALGAPENGFVHIREIDLE